VKKRILQFIGSFHQGGSERQAVALTRLMKQEGSFEVFAATLNKEGILRDRIDEIGLPEIPEFPLTSFYNPNFIRQVWRCSKYLRDNKIDLVHTHDFYTNVFGMAAATLAGVPARVASKRETGGMRTGGQEFIEKIAFGRANAVAVNSEAVRAHLIDLSVSPDKIHTIYNGVDLERFRNIDGNRAEICQKFGLPTGENIRFVTMVANLRHNIKNVPMLLRSAKRVVQKVPNTHFVIAGEGELKAEFKELTKKLGVAENVHFIGRCTDVPSLLSVSYACLLTSNAEGFSNSILEYMAAGKPVVATNVGGTAEVIEDVVNGYLVKSDDDAAMAERLVALLKDENLSLEMGNRGRKTVQSGFSQSAQVSNTIRLYQNCLSK
jgi:glycosyltransferase involved in cell wall biosynthesis